MLGDCLERMQELPDGSVDAVVTDPPYFNVKPDYWDNQWRSETEYLDWIGRLCAEWYRLLKPNGSLYVFASTQRSARVEVKISESFNVLNRITWRKHDGTANKGGAWCRTNKKVLRSFFPASESIIFAEHYGADNMAKGESGWVAKCDDLRGFVFEPLRAYLDGEWKRAGLERKDAEMATGTYMSSHWFSRSQWRLPTEQHYEALRKYANARGGEFLRREYESLRREYESLRREYEFLRREYESLRRPFNITQDSQFLDVWEFKTVSACPGKHPCEKPVELMRHIISTSTRPGMTVLDCFMGGGSTGVACALEGREFIGIELDDGYFTAAEQRIRDTEPPVF